ncbi:putative MFS family arabinose efflux permease [Haloactinopolyspora alba]|uniref:Putative MFS family arabinose efflux permease n=1 Tax=Haloactinopolyspora alba TaxID=648780 RepID=A0A2P8E0W8_9ACTN|nr:MFS transporter [Haloactinopolyspora alba]PSL03110.1 putative MFS family arabinose efflux permease [Haloactinopolyspora alba]
MSQTAEDARLSRTAAGTDPPPGTGTVALLVATAMVVLTQLYAAIPLLGPVGEDLGGDVTFALASCFSLCYAVGFLTWGPLADQYGHKRAMAIGVSVLAVATIGCAFAPSTDWLAVWRGVQGLAAASFAPAAVAYFAEALPPSRRPAAIGALSIALLASGIVGQVLASWAAVTVGWPWLFLASAIALAAAGAAIARSVRQPARNAPRGHVGHRFVAVARVATRRSVQLLCAANATLLLSFVGMYTALGPHLDTLGLDESGVLWLRLVGLPGMFAALFAGRLALRWGTAGAARIGFTVAAYGLAGEAVMSGSLAGVCVASLVFVTGVAIVVPSMLTLFVEAAAPDRAGGIGLNGFVMFLGASLGPIVATATTNFTVLLLALAGLLAVAAWCIATATKFAPSGARP